MSNAIRVYTVCLSITDLLAFEDTYNYVSPPKVREHIVFGADPVRVCVTFSCVQNNS